MKKIPFYFYLLCFAALLIVWVVDFFAKDEYIYMMILAQLIWGPIAIIHCIYKFFTTRNSEGKIPKLYAGSLAVTLIYFLVLGMLMSLEVDFVDEDFAFKLGVFALPWLMLAYFTGIQYLELKETI